VHVKRTSVLFFHSESDQQVIFYLAVILILIEYSSRGEQRGNFYLAVILILIEYSSRDEQRKTKNRLQDVENT